MARKKLTASQRKANKKRQYTRYEYNLTVDALDYLNLVGENIKFKIVNNPTKASLKKIRKIYNEATKKLRKKNYVLPTKREMAKEVRVEQPYRRHRAKTKSQEAPPTFQPDTDYIDELIEAVSGLRGIERSDKRRTHARDEEKLQDAKQRFFDKLAYARTKAGDTELATQLAADDFIQRVEDLSVRYDYEITDEIDDTLIPMLETAMYNVLDSY